jgi:catechol 2,3-dioxygenase-like lactoylglutathione lyase family enzyme
MKERTATYGLTHIAVAVSDLERTKRFYQSIFDMEVMYSTDAFLQLTTPGCHDIIVFEKKSDSIGKSGGIAHFGFRLRDPKGIASLERKILAAGGVIKDQGQFVPGSPYIFFYDPDGYEVEVWYEFVPLHNRCLPSFST